MIREADGISVKLGNEYAKWNKAKENISYSLWMRGYAFINDLYYYEKTLVEHISAILGESSPESHISALKDIIPKLNGCWSLVYKTNGFILAAVDRCRSIPLFYGVENNKFFLSDSAEEVLNFISNKELDDISVTEFLLAGYVTGKETLYKDLNQIQPGEILEIKNINNFPLQINTHHYYRFIFKSDSQAGEQELENELVNILDNMFNRYAIALKGKNPVIPLSGGLDSRLMTSMFKRHGVENATCLCYGRKDNTESQASRKVAEALGYRWFFYPYNEEAWYNWFREDQFKAYMAYSGNYANLPHLQDFPAINSLLSELPASNLVFTPGHSLDMLCGSHIPAELYFSKRKSKLYNLVPESVLKNHFKLWPWHHTSAELKDTFIERIRQILPHFNNNKGEAIGAYETWDFECRQARFIINSVRAYEFLGCEWMLPWWDYELMDFFLKLKVNLRYKKRLYRDTLLNKVFIDDLANIATIPVVGLPLQGKAMQKLENGVLHICPYLIKLKDLLKKVPQGFINSNNHRQDFHAFHGMFSTSGFSDKLENVIPISDLPLIVQRMIYPCKDEAINDLFIVGLISLYYLYNQL